MVHYHLWVLVVETSAVMVRVGCGMVVVMVYQTHPNHYFSWFRLYIYLLGDEVIFMLVYRPTICIHLWSHITYYTPASSGWFIISSSPWS